MKHNLVRYALTAFLVVGTSGCAGLLKPADSHSTPADDHSSDALDTRYAPAGAGGPSCEAAVNAWEKAQNPGPIIDLKPHEGESSDAYRARINAEPSFATLFSAAKRVAECDQYPYLFEHVVHYGESEGEKILVELEKGGAPVEAEFAKYLASHKGPQFFALKEGRPNDAVYGLRHITHWLVQKGRGAQYCPAIADAAKGANMTARMSLFDYLRDVKCKEGIAVGVETLLDDEARNRSLSCILLGSIGDASVLDKVKTVADTDGYSTVKEQERDGRIFGMKVYPVRDACLEAYGKIKLRM
jgi:hypothetical protein